MSIKKNARHRANGSGVGKAASVKRVVVDFPEPLFAQLELAAAECSVNRSELIRRAVAESMQARERARLEQELIEGYTMNAGQVRAGCDELVHLESDFQ